MGGTEAFTCYYIRTFMPEIYHWMVYGDGDGENDDDDGLNDRDYDRAHEGRSGRESTTGSSSERCSQRMP